MNSFFISWVCFTIMSVPTPYRDACSKAIEASTHELGIKQNFDQIEGYIREESQRRIPPALMTIGGLGYSGVVKKELKFKFRVQPWIDQVNVSGNQNSGSLSLTWNI